MTSPAPNPDTVELLFEVSTKGADLMDLLSGNTRQVGDRELTDNKVDLLRHLTTVDLEAEEAIWQREADRQKERLAARKEFRALVFPYMTKPGGIVQDALKVMPPAQVKRALELAEIVWPDGYIYQEKQP